jgi:hypothetical protein
LEPPGLFIRHLGGIPGPLRQLRLCAFPVGCAAVVRLDLARGRAASGRHPPVHGQHGHPLPGGKVSTGRLATPTPRPPYGGLRIALRAH